VEKSAKFIYIPVCIETRMEKINKVPYSEVVL
jgi:hypothetical protein